MTIENNVDIKFTKTEQLWDISLNSDGDLEGVESPDTAINMSLFTDKRADDSEIQSSELRRGWIGNLFNGVIEYEIGSKLWLLYQSRKTNETANRGIDFIRNSLQWLIDDNLARDIKVTATRTVNNIEFDIIIIRKDSEVERIFTLWENSQWQ